MVEVGNGGIFDTKVVDYQREGEFACTVAEEVIGMATLFVKVFGEEDTELFVNEDDCLWEPVHTLSYSDHDILVVCKYGKIVLVVDFCWEYQ